MSERDSFDQPDFSRVMIRDRYRLRRQRHRILDQRKKGLDDSQPIAKWQADYQESVARRVSRQTSVPSVQLDRDLPIAARADEIAEALRDHQVVVISGETGSGKSTQLPLICLQTGLGAGGFIGHTQPRRIAARGVASRIAEQLGTTRGKQVGYKIRFGDQTGPETLVKVMTDGILLAETGSDRYLNQYEVIIIDEAHERSLNIDFLLGYIKRLLPSRPDLKVIITSATIDTQKFADHFTEDPEHPVPVINVEGRTYPVEIQYRPVGFDAQGNPVEQDLETATVAAIKELARRDRGDMLVFLPTENAIRNLARKLRSAFAGDGPARTEVLPLYARLSTEQQNSIFKPGSARRIVLATNVAESSITVPRIRYVVDQGLARISRYAPRSKVQRLPIESISQASADQRAGRCGRVGPGVCVRLYAQDDFEQRPRFTTPEIRRTNLASVILQTRALNLGPIESFPFIEAPTPESIRDGFKTLHEIGAVDQRRDLTPLGKQLSRLPVDPRIGRMLYAASELGCLSEVLIIAAALEVQDPRVRPPERQAAADQAHQPFLDEDSDFMAKLNLWQWLHERRESLSRSKFRKACASRFLSYMLVQQWMDVHRQLKSLAREHRMDLSSDPDNYQSIHCAILTGLLSGVGMHTDRREYTGQGGIRFLLWPGSGVVKVAADRKQNESGKQTKGEPPGKPSGPAWILVSEIVETGKRFGRTVARINPDWIEPLAGHIVKRSYSEPHWSKKRQSAVAWEKVSLYGLPIVVQRAVRYGNIDPVLSRQLLIEQGLAADQMKTDFPFLVHNRGILEEIQAMAAKTRQRELVVDDYQVRKLYEERLPEAVFDGGELSGALKKDSELDKKLRFQIQDFIPDPESGVTAEDFPAEMQIGDLRLPVEYRFTPGNIDDGVNIQVPLEGVAQIHENHLGWSVPGLLQPRIISLIRSLPKSIRRQLVPAPETAAAVAEQIAFGVGSFLDVIAGQLSQIAGETILPEQFRLEKLDDSQKVNIQVCDEDGSVIAQARSLSELKSQLPVESPGEAIEAPADSDWQQDGLVDWSWGELPDQIIVRRGVADVPLFPAIVTDGDAVDLRLFDDRYRAEQLTRHGLATLFRISNKKHIRSQVNWLPELDSLSLIAAHLFGSSDVLKPALAQLIALIAFVDGRPSIKDRAGFESNQAAATERISIATQKLAPWLSRWLNAWQQCRLELEALSERMADVRDDIQRQFDHLFTNDFLEQVPWQWLQHYPRYLEAVLVRLDRLRSGSLDRDRECRQELDPLIVRFEERKQALRQQGTVDPELDYFGWMLQEFRVSLFAQKLGTSETVSVKRLDKQWQKVRLA